MICIVTDCGAPLGRLYPEWDGAFSCSSSSQEPSLAVLWGMPVLLRHLLWCLLALALRFFFLTFDRVRPGPLFVLVIGSGAMRQAAVLQRVPS